MCNIVLSLLLLLGADDKGEVPDTRSFWQISIKVENPALKSLAESPRKSVPARIEFNNAPGIWARVKLKGRSTFQPIEQKPSFTLSFDDADAATVPFAGTKIHLNNSVDDESLLKEKIGSELFIRAGIPAQRVAHARLMLNGRELGLYVLKEGFSPEFIRRNFGDAGGIIYDPESADLKNAFGTLVNLDASLDDPERTRLEELRLAAEESDPSKREERLERVLAFDEFVKFTSIEMLLCHWDGYSLSRNNYRIYMPQNGRIRFLPAGMDQVFAKADLSWKPRFSATLTVAVLETARGAELYDAAFAELLPKVLDVNRISNRIAEIVRELSPHLSRAEQRKLRAEAEDLNASIAARNKSLRAQLKK